VYLTWAGDVYNDARKVVNEMIIRPATQKDVEQWYGSRPLFGLRALVAELDGAVIAIAGVYRSGDNYVAVCGSTPEMRRRKRDVIAMIAESKKLFRHYPFVLAFQSEEEPTAESFLRHVGFSRVGRAPLGGLHIWATKH